MNALSIASIPAFAECDRRALAKLLPETELREFAPGEILFKAGATAHDVFFIESGKIRLSDATGEIDTVTRGFVGEEAALDSARYMANAIADTLTRALLIPASALHELFDRSPMTRSHLVHSLISHSNKQPVEMVRETKHEIRAGHDLRNAFGWLMAIVVPALVYWWASSASPLSWNAINFLTIFAAASVMWVFNLLPEYIPALFIVMACIVLGVVPDDVILSGYSSGSFFMALSVFGIGAVLAQSGLTYRFVLWLLLRMPQSGFWYRMTLFFIGFLLTPVLPSANGRASLLSPLLDEMIHVLGYKKKGTAATAMAAAAFVGISLFSAAFITSKSANFAVFGLFPEQIKDQFTWSYWLFASLVAVAVMFVLYLVVSAFLFREHEEVKLSRDSIQLQLAILGRMSHQEWAALFGVSLFILGVTTSGIHKIASPWIGMAILYILISLGSLSKNGLRRDIDWPFLLMLGGFVGMSAAMGYLGIDEWFAHNLMWIGELMKQNFYLFTLVFGIAIYLIRLVIPNTAATVLLASMFMPLAERYGINPWVIAFMVILFSDGWFAPYQCSYYLQFEAENEKKQVFARPPMLTFNMWTNAFRFLAVWASIPFWKSLGFM